MFAAKTQKMFCPAGNNYFTALKIGKFNRVADKIAPGSGTIGDYHGIVFVQPYFCYIQRMGVWFYVPVTIKIIFVKGNKFEEHFIVGDQLHTLFFIWALLVS